MEKTDDISQWAWAKAREIRVLSDMKLLSNYAVDLATARALQTAKAEAYEEAAKLVDVVEKNDFDGVTPGLADDIRKLASAQPPSLTVR